MALLALPVALCIGAQTPNILFVLADDIGWGDLSYNKDYLQPGAGGEKWVVNPARTPNIDTLAEMKGTMRFDRFYAGSAVCSPTRSSVMSGRSPRRECIDNAEGCGQQPAWSCYDKLPFPHTTYTVAEAARSKGYSTFFAGKWHLGDFWVKGEPPTYAMKKWPSSNPGHHGFEEWHATEASAESSTPNCGCVAEWKDQGKGCITGSGEWVHDALDCTNYWRNAQTPSPAACLDPATTDRPCVANLTEKIEGDDTEYIMDLFEGFLEKRDASKPFLAFLWLHTNHVPHYALPEWYHAYNDTMGNVAGNYLGTISQMDSQIGRLHQLMTNRSLDDNTLMWFTADNGAHIGNGLDQRAGGQLSSSNGLRQCKASLFEGGIREPGFIRWPRAIGEFKQTNYTASTVDFLPTVLDLLDIAYPNPSWAVDGMSLLPLLNGSLPLTARRSKPLGFGQSGQWALLNTTSTATWKIVANPVRGQCPDMLPPYVEGATGPYLFDLDVDPTESHDLCASEPQRCQAMKDMLAEFEASVLNSRVNESGCAAPGGTDIFQDFGVQEAGATQGKRYTTRNGCLGAFTVGGADYLSVVPCEAGSAVWGNLTSACVALPEAGCVEDEPLLLHTAGDCKGRTAGLVYNPSTGRIHSKACPSLCVAGTESSKVAQVTTATVSLAYCSTYGMAFTETTA